MSRNYFFRSAGIVMAALFIMTVLNSSAQDSSRYISMAEVISATLNTNKEVQLAKLDENIAASGYKQTQAIFLPQVSLSYSAMSTNNPLYAFGFVLQQKSITQSDFNPTLLNNPSATADFMTQVRVEQPLVNMDLLYKRKAAARQTEFYQYKTQRTREYLSFQARKAYLELQLNYDALKVLNEALSNAQYVYTFTDNHFLQGLVQKSDLLNAEVQMTGVESSLAKAKSNIRNASDNISQLMNQKEGIIYLVDSATQAEPSMDNVILGIPSSRADFLSIQKAIESTDLMIKANRMTYLPKLNAFGTYQFNDSRMLGFGASAYLAGVQLSWDIFKGNATKNAIATQTLERNKLSVELARQKDQSQFELSKYYRDLSDAAFEVKQQKVAIEQASEALLILQNRYRQGLVNTTDVLAASTQLTQQKFALARAVFTIHVTEAYIQLLTTSTNQ
jgi:outer membrane protein TolC